MIDTIGTHPNSSGLGDVLLLTAVCKHFPDLVVQLHPNCSKFSFLFNGLCKRVEFTETPTHTKGVYIENGTFSQYMLKEFGYEGEDSIPFVFTNTEKYLKAKKKIEHIKNPIIVKFNCAPRWKHVREYDVSKFQSEIDKLIEQKYTPIQTGTSDNFTPMKGCITMIDLELEDLCALYKAVGIYFGTDTGDFHLMLAVGGSCTVICPKIPSIDYDPNQFVHKTSRVTRKLL